MKKYKFILLSLVAVLAFTAFGFSNSTNANAKSKTKYAITFPKKMRGTWYSFSRRGKSKLTKLVVNSRHMYFYKYVNGKAKKENDMTVNLKKKFTEKESEKAYRVENLALYQKDATGTYEKDLANNSKKHGKKNYLTWIKLYPHIAGGDFAFTYVNMSKLAKHNVLTYSVNKVVPTHFYKSKKIAKKQQHKKYPIFVYSLSAQNYSPEK
ncbi:hypothetical protein MUB42_02940 [Apilactobacillus kunkeei]|nr:hypothetical protein MUB42_02940 [Apilactobacillus kunkeei]